MVKECTIFHSQIEIVVQGYNISQPGQGGDWLEVLQFYQPCFKVTILSQVILSFHLFQIHVESILTILSQVSSQRNVSVKSPIGISNKILSSSCFI